MALGNKVLGGKTLVAVQVIDALTRAPSADDSGRPLTERSASMEYSRFSGTPAKTTLAIAMPVLSAALATKLSFLISVSLA